MIHLLFKLSLSLHLTLPRGLVLSSLVDGAGLLRARVFGDRYELLRLLVVVLVLGAAAVVPPLLLGVGVLGPAHGRRALVRLTLLLFLVPAPLVDLVFAESDLGCDIRLRLLRPSGVLFKVSLQDLKLVDVLPGAVLDDALYVLVVVFLLFLLSGRISRLNGGTAAALRSGGLGVFLLKMLRVLRVGNVGLGRIRRLVRVLLFLLRQRHVRLIANSLRRGLIGDGCLLNRLAVAAAVATAGTRLSRCRRRRVQGDGVARHRVTRKRLSNELAIFEFELEGEVGRSVASKDILSVTVAAVVRAG